jgi:hypothetical protein
MLTIDPKTTPNPQMHAYLHGAIILRPIALASTIDTYEASIRISL